MTVIKRMPIIALWCTFRLQHAFFTSDPILGVFALMLTSGIMYRYPMMMDQYRLAIGRIQLCRMVRDGKKDKICSTLRVTSLAGNIHYIDSDYMHIIDPHLIRADSRYFEDIIYKSYPVWLGDASAVVVRKGGEIKDVNLFKAVMNGHSIELAGNLAKESQAR